MDKMKNTVENRLRELLSPGYPKLIYEAMAYSVFMGGKRLRPLLLLGAYEAASGASAVGAPIDFACALEMIHCYSLIHDDLPAMDDDDLRRGMPTNHKVYGEAMAILAGDALLNTAFEVMSAACVMGGEREKSAMLRIAQASGVRGMIGGQAADMFGVSGKTDGELLTYIHMHKTGALIRAALVAGADLGGAGETTLSRLDAAACELGLAFQIKDDILDITSTETELGKPVGSDARNKKLTYTSLYGLERANEEYARLSNSAAAEIKGLFGQAALLLGIVDRMTERNS